MKITIKNIVISFIYCIAFGSVSLILSSCIRQNYIDKVNNYWSLNLPKSMDLIYQYEDKGFEDALYYYVYETDIEQLSIEFSVIDENTLKKINETCLLSFSNVEEEFKLTAEHNYLYFYKSKDGGFKYIYLLYDNRLSRLTILEVN